MASLCVGGSGSSRLSPSDPQVQRLKRYLQSSNPTRVYKVLVEIRVNHASGNQEKAKIILESDLIKNLLAVLKKNDLKLTNLTLSILGNLLIHREARNQFKLYDGIKNVVPIFKTVENESILGRATRVLANAWMDGLGVSPPDHGLLSSLVTVLGKSSLPPTVVSIFRVIRIFCQRSAKVCSALLKVAFVEQSMKFLQSSSEDVLVAVLKSLTAVSFQEAEKLGGQLVESNLSLLIKLCSHPSPLVWELALETIVNLCESQSLRPALGSEGAILLFITKINSMGNDLKRPTYDACLSALCSFSAEAVNRVRLRELGGLALFLDVLACSDGNNKKSLQHVVRSLNNFSYDTQSLKLLQAKGMTLAFMNLIERYVNAYKVKHCCKSEKPIGSLKNNQPEDQSGKLIVCRACNKFLKGQRVGGSQGGINSRTAEADSKQELDNDSMEEEYSEIEFGPPFEFGEDSEEEDLSKNPSFVSDLEPTTKINEVLCDPQEEMASQDKQFRISSPSYQQVILEQEEFDKVRSVEHWVPRNILMESKVFFEKIFLNRNCTEHVVLKQRRLNSERSGIHIFVPPCYREREKAEDYLFIDGIFLILQHIQASNLESNEAYSFRATKAVVSYIKNTRHPSKAARNYLVQIAKSMYFLIPSVRNYQFPWLIKELSPRCKTATSQCPRCSFNESLKNELFVLYSKIAESGFGIGILNNSLVSGNRSEMHSAAVATPLVIKGKSALCNTLLSHNGIKVLVEILKNPSDDEVFFSAVLGVQELAKTLKFESPALNLPRLGNIWRQRKKCKYDKNDLPKDAAFLMDDDAKIFFNKETLCKNISYFSAMFGGDFRESSLAEVPMRYRSTQAMIGLIHLVYGCESCASLSGMGAVDLVELLYITDELLLEESERLVAAMILRKCNSPSSALLVYSKTKQERARLLGVDDGLHKGFFEHILGVEMRLVNRVKLFQSIVNSSFGNSFIEDLENCIKIKLAGSPKR